MKSCFLEFRRNLLQGLPWLWGMQVNLCLCAVYMTIGTHHSHRLCLEHNFYLKPVLDSNLILKCPINVLWSPSINIFLLHLGFTLNVLYWRCVTYLRTWSNILYLFLYFSFNDTFHSSDYISSKQFIYFKVRIHTNFSLSLPYFMLLQLELCSAEDLLRLWVQ